MCKVMTKMERKLKFVKDYINNREYYRELYKCYPNNTYDNPCVQVWEEYYKDDYTDLNYSIHIGSDRKSLTNDYIDVIEEFNGWYENIIDIIKLYNYIEFKYGYISFY